MMHGAAIDSKRFRSVMGSFPTGVAVIGIECDGELFELTDIRVARALHARQRDGSGPC